VKIGIFPDSVYGFPADVNIHALIAKYGIDIQIVRPEMTKFKMFRVKVNMDFHFVGIIVTVCVFVVSFWIFFQLLYK
jgi:hypothetical protein